MPSRRPEETIIFPIVVDSPPGTMIPTRPSRSSTDRTSTGSTPRPRRISACSLKSPWSASTPTRFGPSPSRTAPFVSPLPATGREPLSFREVPHLPADHRLAETPAGLRDGLRVLEVGRRGHDGPRPHGRVPAFEDAAADDRAHVAHGLDHVTGAGFALGTDHGGTLADAPQGFPEVRRPTNKWHLEDGLVYVVLLVGRRKDLGLVDIVDFEGLQDLGFDEVTDTGLRHHGDGDRVLDLHDLLGVAHPRDAAVGPDVGRHPLQGHDRDGPGLLGDPGLLRVHHVHDDAALEHLGHP